MPASNELVLYHYWRSSCSWRVRWGLELKGLGYKKVAVDLLKGEQHLPEYKKISPMGHVPCLVQGKFAMAESLAILEWLEEAYPHAPKLLPVAPEERQIARQIALMIAAGIQPLQNLGILRAFSNDDSKRQSFARDQIASGLANVERALIRCSGTYAIGGSITLADLFIVPQCYNALRFGIDLKKYPIICNIYLRALSTPACDRAAPHSQPDAPPNTKSLLP